MCFIVANRPSYAEYIAVFDIAYARRGLYLFIRQASIVEMTADTDKRVGKLCHNRRHFHRANAIALNDGNSVRRCFSTLIPHE
jgi:hypothetical protein